MSKDLWPDEEIIRKIKAGTIEMEQASLKLYDNEKYWNTVAKMVMNQIGDKDTIHDVLADSILILVRKIEEDKFDYQSTLYTYFIGIAKNVMRNYSRKLKKDNLIELPGELANIVKEVSQINIEPDALELLIQQILDTLGEPCKSILNCWAFTKSSDGKKIAKQLNYYTKDGEPDTKKAKRETHRCRKKVSDLVHQTPQFRDSLRDSWN